MGQSHGLIASVNGAAGMVRAGLQNRFAEGRFNLLYWSWLQCLRSVGRRRPGYGFG
jgi:hypothetical protein